MAFKRSTVRSRSAPPLLEPARSADSEEPVPPALSLFARPHSSRRGRSTVLLTFSGAVSREPAIETWLEAQPAELAAMARRWFSFMRHCGTDVEELMHDAQPTVCVQDAPYAYVDAFRAHVNVGFFHGVALADPAGLLEGAGKHMRHVKLKPDRPVDVASLEALIAAAYLDIRARVRAGEGSTTAG